MDTVKQLLDTTRRSPCFNKQKAEIMPSSTNIAVFNDQTASKGMKVQLTCDHHRDRTLACWSGWANARSVDLLYRDTFIATSSKWFRDGERAMIIASHEVCEDWTPINGMLILKQGHCSAAKEHEDIENDYFIIDKVANNHSKWTRNSTLTLTVGLEPLSGYWKANTKRKLNHWVTSTTLVSQTYSVTQTEKA